MNQKKAIIDKGFVVGVVQGDIDAPVIPESLIHIHISQLLINENDEVVDASTFTEFYINNDFRKLLIKPEQDSVKLTCSYSDIIIKNESDEYVVATQTQINQITDKNNAVKVLSETDTQISRGIEDIIDLLISKSLAVEGDFDSNLMQKIIDRKSARVTLEN